MLRLQIISLFLAIVLSVQMVPVASIGAMISTNQWNEELPHNATDTGKIQLLMSSFIIPSSFQSIPDAFATKALGHLHISGKIPTNHSNDVLTPPPDLSM